MGLWKSWIWHFSKSHFSAGLHQIFMEKLFWDSAMTVVNLVFYGSCLNSSPVLRKIIWHHITVKHNLHSLESIPTWVTSQVGCPWSQTLPSAWSPSSTSPSPPSSSSLCSAGGPQPRQQDNRAEKTWRKTVGHVWVWSPLPDKKYTQYDFYRTTPYLD